MKRSEVSIKTWSTPASLLFKGQVTKHTTVKWSLVELSWSSAVLANSLDRKYILPVHLRLLLLALRILLRKNSTTKPTQQGELREKKKNSLSEPQRARNSLIFRCGCKHETPWCKRLKVK